MVKRVHIRRGRKTYRVTRQMRVSYYLKAYFITVLIGVFVFSGAKVLVKPPPPCANSKSCSSDLTEKIENGAIGMFMGRNVKAPDIDLTAESKQPSILGTNAPSEEKHIYVDLSTQMIYAYEGTNQIFKTFTSTGRWNKTPVGNFHIWTKLRSTRMSGGEGAAAYDLPNVPYVMYFYHDFGLHGAYWHDNFGRPMSHGCINMRIEEAKILYQWATPIVTNEKAWSTLAKAENPGTRVVIYGTTPKE